jgi:hypothetical protein
MKGFSMHKIELTTPTQPATTVPAVNNSPVDPQPTMNNNQGSASTVKPVHTATSMRKTSSTGFIIVAIIAIVAGIGTGYGSSKLYAKSQGLDTNIQKVATEGSIQNGDVFGSADTSSFKDSAKGYLEAGGLDNEGTHHLVREGGNSQTVYLTSSVTDLSTLEGMEVEVWGETFKGQKAGWLMDVGRIQVVEVQGQKPADEE